MRWLQIRFDFDSKTVRHGKINYKCQWFYSNQVCISVTSAIRCILLTRHRKLRDGKFVCVQYEEAVAIR